MYAWAMGGRTKRVIQHVVVCLNSLTPTKRVVMKQASKKPDEFSRNSGTGDAGTMRVCVYNKQARLLLHTHLHEHVDLG